jgi:hypothetical protein
MSEKRAIATINETMRDCLPPGAPLSFTKITNAELQGSKCIVANVVMFDGLPAVLHLNRWELGWSHGWDSMPGGDCYLDEDGAWKRVTNQYDLFQMVAA